MFHKLSQKETEFFEDQFHICYINLSYQNVTFPELLKEAEVIPVFKKGDHSQLTNYRPISLLSNIGKLFEKITRNRLYYFLEMDKCWYNSQFSFRNNRSTNHTLVNLIKNVQVSIDSGGFACSVFIDLQKAFDTVNHVKLLDKLENYGGRGEG